MTKKTIIALAGLPASGKSAVAIRLHKALNSLLLDKDNVRESLFQQHVDYSRAQNDFCVEVMYQTALYVLAEEHVQIVIIDGRSFSRTYQIDALKCVAAKAESRLCIVECVCSASSARARLKQDEGVHPAKDRNFAMYTRSSELAEPITEPRLTLDTDKWSADECARKALAYVTGST